ncbi:MAG: hypothetical protein ACFCGT_05710 [Sandaracinaceae bacterium]
MRHAHAPYPATWTVERARDAYLAENGFTPEAYDDRWTEAVVGPLRLYVPNTRRHRWAIRLHDLHHAVTGYGTDLAGEGEVSAWELRRGLQGVGPYIASIVVAGVLAGLLVAPKRTLAAWRSSGRASGSLFQLARPYEELLGLPLGELRVELGVPRGGLADRPRGLHAAAPRVSGGRGAGRR